MASDENEPLPGLSRRGFLKGTGLSVAAASLISGTTEALAAEATSRPIGPDAVPLHFKVNGVAQSISVEPRTTLVEALRVHLGLTGTKVVCDRGACSACTVLLDGVPVCSCLMPALDAAGRAVVTVEGLGKGGQLHPVQSAFIAHDAMQCGFCTPGMVMSCAALLSRNTHPTEAEVRTAVSGNLCRCGTYPKVIAATLAASGQTFEGATLTLTGDGEKRAPADGKVLAGIVGDKISDEERPLPAGEPPPWPTNAGLAVVGKPTPRVDGKRKVTGAARYTADVQLPGMLYARRVCSPHPHAKVRAVDTSAAERLPGVKAVHVVERRSEGAQLRDPSKVPSTKYPTVLYAGQCVAAVAATSQAIADEAARLVNVDYEPLPFVVDLGEARAANAPLVFPGPVDMAGSAGGGGAAKGLPQSGNVRGPNSKTKGDLAHGFAQAAVTVEGTFRTQVQTHSALEPHGVVADWSADGLTVYSSTQGTASVRDELATVFDLPKSRVHVISEFMGGGFGAKFGVGHYGVVATHLSRAAGKPVRLVLDRKEEHLCVGNRPSSLTSLKVGATRDGTLTAIQLTSHGTAGIACGAGIGPWVERLYPAPNFSSEQFDVFTNAGPGAAFRAPGAPQSMFALEQLVDELAEKLKIDPLALRDKIDVSPEPAPEREARRLERKIGAERIGWGKRRPPASDGGSIKRGIGVAQAVWGRFVDTDSSCEVRIARDGSVELGSSVADLGTGTRTALAQIVAEELGLRAEDVTVKIGDTRFPQGPGSGGSKTLLGISPAARNAAFQAKQQLFAAVAPSLHAKPEELALEAGRLFVRAEPSRALPWKRACAKLPREQLSVQATRPADYGGDPHAGYGGVQFAAISVDTETGVVRVERVVAIHECGRPINPLAIQSQISGGVLQAISWALYEDRHLDPKSGRMLNPNLDQYKIAGARETPAIDVVLLEEYLGRSSTDANGIGEPANIATAAAIANAFYNATGARIRELPMSPEAVLAALAHKKEGR
jgi:xanthine dehydrogenase YagR molybdenum-binding subunit